MGEYIRLALSIMKYKCGIIKKNIKKLYNKIT